MNEFQAELYSHLAEWKQTHGSKKSGEFKGRPNNLIFPDSLEDGFHIFPAVRQKVKTLEFKKHKFFRHMASSQAACINLFVPLLQYPDSAASILRTIKPDLASIAVDKLDGGYQLEFWGEDYASNTRGFLNDHNIASGTDADIAIAYRDNQNQLNLWLIEHKLSEAEFTVCKAATSKGRTRKHRCKPASEIYADPDLCYYHSGKSFWYWRVTKEAKHLFPASKFFNGRGCPFQGGLNQLWRNLLLAFEIEKRQEPFKKVFFSVVHHPGNKSLDRNIQQFKQLLDNSDRFFTFTSKNILSAAQPHQELAEWANWYQELYLWKKVW